MPLWFWLDVAAFGISTVVATALVLMTLAAGFSHPVNRRFAAFAAAEAAWAICSLLLRLSLWTSTGNPLLLLELATLAFALMGPLLLMFAVRYVGGPIRRVDLVAALGILAAAVFSFPLFRHQIILDPHLEMSGVVTYSLTRWGMVLSVLPALYFLWSLVLFWRERRQTRELYMAVSVLILLIGFVIGGVVGLNVPVMSFTVTFSMLVLGYGIVSRQLLNPLRELTSELEKKVAERTRELEKVAARLEDANVTLERRAVQLATAAEVAREAAAIRDVGELLDRVVHLISDRFGFYHAGIFLVDELKEYAVLRAASSEGGQRMLERRHRLRIGEEGIVGYVAGSGEPRIALDVGEDAVYFDNPDLPATRSEMALPLKVRGEIIGVLDVQSKEPAAFSKEDVAALQAMADQIALAIENARLLKETQERLREVGLLLRQQDRERWEEWTARRPAWGYVYDGVEVMPKEAARELGGEPGLVVPLRTRGGTIGRLVLAIPNRPLSQEEEALIQEVAEQAGLALENARLFQETQQALGEMEALYRASRAIGEATSMQEIVLGAAEVAMALGFSACSLTLVTATDEAGVPVRGDVYSVLSGEEGFVSVPPIRDFPLTDRVAAQRVTEDPDLVLIYADAEDPQSPMPEPARETMRNIGMRGMITLGLTVGGRPLGFLTFTSAKPLTGFSKERARRVRTVADQVAIAVERQQLLKQTLRRAERERLRAEIVGRVRASTDMEVILQTAIRELGRALRASEGLIRLETGNGVTHK